MADEAPALRPVTKDPDDAAAVAVLQATPEIREAELLRLFLSGPRAVRFNAIACARLAGYGREDGTSDDEVLRVIASRILHNPRNVARIRRALDRMQGGIDRQIEELSRIAYAKLSDYVRWDDSGVTITAMQNLDEDQLSAVGSVVERTEKDGTKTVEFKLKDAIAAHQLLYRLQQLAGPHFADDDSGDGTTPQRTFTLVLGPTQHVHHHHHGNGTVNGGPTNGHAEPPPTSGEEDPR